ncbi:MAG: sugar transferase [bacterium]|nr:sugar transferase [bacterium]
MLKEKGRQLSWLFFIGDIIAVVVSFITAYFGRQSITGIPPFNAPLFPLLEYMPLLALLILVSICVFFFSGMYQPVRTGYLRAIVDMIKVSILGIVISFALAFCLKLGYIARSLLLLFWVIVPIFISIFRIGGRNFFRLLGLKGYNHHNILIVGCGEMAEKVAAALKQHPEFGFRIVGFIDDGVNNKEMKRVTTMSTPDDFPQILHNYIIDEVVFAVPFEAYERLSDIIKLCEIEGVRVRIVADLFKRTLAHARADDLDGIPLVTLESGPTQEAALVIKKIGDIIISSLALILLAPVFLIIAITIKIDSPGHVLFAQERVGQNGRRFNLLKFRSMIKDAEKMVKDLQDINEVEGPVFKIENDPRITKVGRFLRKTSLDELPQLINVLKGEMSLVGPRPPLPNEVSEYKNWQRRRLSMKPGITCIWQVSGRSTVSFDRWMEMDMEYIDNWSLWLDIKILFKTTLVVFYGKGAY